MDDLILTLGHNSSAILVRDGKIVAGYEEERMSGIKSDSHFPEQSIQELDNRFGITSPTIFISHWQLHGDVNLMSPKHWKGSLIKQKFPGSQIFQTNDEFTHHDAHAWSAILFGESMPCQSKDKTYIFVMDGFGTYGEHISIYRFVDGIPILLTRKYGFGTSLGLLYQYTTAYLGMKQNQDEYKLLAYEAYIEDVAPKILFNNLRKSIETYSEIYLTKLAGFATLDRSDPLLNLGALPVFASSVADMLSAVLVSCTKDQIELTEREKRIVIAYFTQSVVENVVLHFVHEYAPVNVLLVGGLFYNVKLNNLIANEIAGKTCIMPLAGDQGAGLGLYKAMHSGFKWPGHLYWGPRTLKEESFADIDGLIFTKTSDDGWESIRQLVGEGHMVNVVEGNMEFGPRALCHTSTIARPSLQMARDINFVNHRVNEMPFAPLVNATFVHNLEGFEKIHKSLEYMICTRNLKPGTEQFYQGACHKYPLEDKYTVRPQVVKPNTPIDDLVSEFGPLINTSFNYHGVPIVWNELQIRHTHVMEQSHECSNPPITVVIGE